MDGDGSYRKEPGAALGSFIGGDLARTMRLLLICGAIALVAACEGDNLFDGSATDYRPRVSHLSVPNPAPGDTAYARVDAQALRGVSAVIVSASGALHMDTVVSLSPPQPNVTISVPIVVPLTPTNTDLFVQAQAIDVYGNPSRVAEIAATVDGPPAVLGASAPTTVPGQTAEIEVTAFGTRPVTSFDLRIRGAVDKDTTALVVPARTNVLRLIRFEMPGSVPEQTMTIEITARDDRLRVSAPFTITVQVVN